MQYTFSNSSEEKGEPNNDSVKGGTLFVCTRVEIDEEWESEKKVNANDGQTRRGVECCKTLISQLVLCHALFHSFDFDTSLPCN